MAKEGISLLPKKGLEGTALGKVFDWVFSVGRYIVVFTELIVIGAFLSRFWLDRKNTDLTEQIRQQRAILESTQTFEQEFRLFQSKLQVIAKGLEEETDLIGPYKTIVDTLPADLFLTSFTWSEEDKQASVMTAVFSEAGLAGFVNNLLGRQNVDSVEIGTIKKDKNTKGMQIRIIVNFKEQNGN